MITNVKLTSHSFHHPDPSTRVITHDTDWISNLHWQIQRDNVINQIYITPEDYKDQFRKPYTPLLPPDTPHPNNADLWELIAFDNVDVIFTVRDWIYQVRDTVNDRLVDLRLLSGNDANETGNNDKGILHYCFVEDAYMASLGFAIGDQLEGQLNHISDNPSSVFYRLRASDLSRCVTSCTWREVITRLDDTGTEIATVNDIDSLVYNPYAKLSKPGRPPQSGAPHQSRKRYTLTASQILDVLGRDRIS